MYEEDRAYYLPSRALMVRPYLPIFGNFSGGSNRVFLSDDRALFLVLSIGEAGVAETGANSKHPPMVDVLHERQLAESLHHGIVVHNDYGIVILDLGNLFTQQAGQIEAFVLPVARQVLSSALDRAIRQDDSGTSDADERRQLEPVLVGRL